MAKLTEEEILAKKKAYVAKLLCEDDLMFFTAYFFKHQHGSKMVVADLHRQIVAALMRVYRGETKNLVINIPPRYGKTLLAVISFIAWCIAKNPAAKFIHLSYSDELALDNSSKIKELVGSAEFQAFWPITLKADSKSKKNWYTEQGGGLHATAAGGPLTGFGAGSTIMQPGRFDGAIIIDDPHKVDDIRSDIERKKVVERLNTTIKSRRNSRNTPIIIIMQRLHEEDMAGFALANGMGEPFELLKLQGIQEDGKALWPYKHTAAELEGMRVADPFNFSGQYQQEPSPETGDYFKAEWLKYYEPQHLPKYLRFYGASDYAVTDGGGDYTVHLVAGIDPNDDIYLVELWRDRTDSLQWVEMLIELIKLYKPLEWAEETGQISKGIGPLIDKRQREEKAYCFRKQFTMPRGGASFSSKQVGAQAIRGRLAQGKVYFPKHKPWVATLVSEMLKFPAGKYDDQVDALALIGRMLGEMVAAVKPAEPKPWQEPQMPSINDMFKQHLRSKQRDREL